MAGDGNDVIDELNSGTDVDTLLLDGINRADVRFDRPFTDLTDIVIRILATGVTITLDNQFDQEDGVEQIVFDDGTTLGGSNWTLDGILAGLATIYGTSGNDTIYGSSATGDRIDSGAGDDLLYGEEGSDTYIYAAGYGNDFVNERATGTDKDSLVLQGLNQGDIDIERPSSDTTDLVIRIKATGETFTLDNQFDQEDGVEKIIFQDGTILGGDNWTLDGILAGLATIKGTAGAETVTGTSASEKLQGLGGADTLRGIGGSDTYVYAAGDGSDTINDDSGSTTDVDALKLADLTAADITLSRVGEDMQVKVNATGEIVTVRKQFYSTTANWGVERIDFSDATSWDFAAVKANAWIRGTSGDETVAGFATADTLYGDAGNDTLTGGAASDRFVFLPGFGNDTITDFVSGAGSADVVAFDDDVFADFASVLAAASQSGADTLITLDASNTLTLKNTTVGNLHQDDFQFLAA